MGIFVGFLVQNAIAVNRFQNGWFFTWCNWAMTRDINPASSGAVYILTTQIKPIAIVLYACCSSIPLLFSSFSHGDRLIASFV